MSANGCFFNSETLSWEQWSSCFDGYIQTNFSKLESVAQIFTSPLVQIFSCEFCEIFHKGYYTEHFWAGAFDKRKLKVIAIMQTFLLW